MSTAHGEALAMACLAALMLAMTGLALRLRIVKGQYNDWLYAAPIGAAIAIAVMIANLNGVVFSGW